MSAPRNHLRCRRLALLFTILLLGYFAPAVQGQATPTASGPGSFVAVGGGYSQFGTDYGHRDLGGGVVYAELHPQWRFGLEGEARFLPSHSAEDVAESTYLGGVHVSLLRPRRLQPYGKFLAGVGHITLPYGYAHGSFLVYTPGAGLDVAINDRLSLRALDFEYQRWPKFPYGALAPYGVSTGLILRLNRVPRYP